MTTLTRLLGCGCLLLAACAPAWAQSTGSRDLSRQGAGFLGPGRELPDPTGLAAVRIGVLAPENDPAGADLQMGVAMALEEANVRGGLRAPEASAAGPGIPYEMRWRADDGPWGQAGNQTVSLVYEDQVWAIIGGIDGQRMHIAEMIAAKAWIPVLSPTASDASIDYANVPWVFRVYPSDSAEAGCLLQYVRDQGWSRWLLLAETERDAQSSKRRIREQAGKLRLYPLRELDFPAASPESVLEQAVSEPVQCILLWSRPQSGMKLLRALRLKGVKAPVLVPSPWLNELSAGQGEALGPLVSTASPGIDFNSPGLERLRSAFSARGGRPLSLTALYAYDTACLLLLAIQKAGLNRARIRDALADADFRGLTGRIHFNSLGGNPAAPVLIKEPWMWGEVLRYGRIVQSQRIRYKE